jgi:hypothetical protein
MRLSQPDVQNLQEFLTRIKTSEWFPGRGDATEINPGQGDKSDVQILEVTGGNVRL